MNALAKSNTGLPEADPIYAVRDDIARTYNPVDALERMLVNAAAQAWCRLQQASEIENRIFEKTSPMELFASNAEAFRTLTHFVADAARAWRRAMAQLNKAQSSRGKNMSLIPRRYEYAARPTRPS